MHCHFIKNNFAKHKLLHLSVFAFMTISSVLFAITMCLTIQLTGSISHLMTVAQTPDFLQMHTGELDDAAIAEFARTSDDVKDYQLCRFLNVDNNTIYLAENSLSGSSQDNGVCVQSEHFDFLVDMNGQIPSLQPGEIGIPVCYMREYNLKTGDLVTIDSHKFEIVCFIRDSQMNSMMASSKRFLICNDDYNSLLSMGEEEYLIEFLLEEGTPLSAFSTEYTKAGLPANGPTITKSLVLMMNALSDGIMIMIILFVSILVLLVALLCIRFTVFTGLRHDRKEIGMLKALGISKKDIRKLYFMKYIVLSLAADVFGVGITLVISHPLGRQIRELYGNSHNTLETLFPAIAGIMLVSAITLLSIWKMLKQTEKLSALQALFDTDNTTKKPFSIKWYLPVIFLVASGTMLMTVPSNILSTISSPEFVTYMGIGSSEIRIDIRQCEDILANAAQMYTRLDNDIRVADFVRLDTISTRIYTKDGTEINLMVEYGNHSVFPVSYSAGTAPTEANQIALSALNADELALSVGDKLELAKNGTIGVYEICGIYPDITNGGKTAKVADMNLTVPDNAEIMWSIFYVSLNEAVNQNSWIEEYKTFGENGSGLKVSDISSYVTATFGQTIHQIRLATAIAIITASGILFIVLLLFSRLQIADNRKDISLLKALGFSRKAVTKQYERKYICGILLGIITGEIIGLLSGEKITAILLENLGADGFRFILNLPNMFVIILLIIALCMLAVKCGINEIKEIQPAECVAGKR